MSDRVAHPIQRSLRHFAVAAFILVTMLVISNRIQSNAAGAQTAALPTKIKVAISRPTKSNADMYARLLAKAQTKRVRVIVNLNLAHRQGSDYVSSDIRAITLAGDADTCCTDCRECQITTRNL